MIDWRRVRVRTLAIWFAGSFAAFSGCCYLAYAWHTELSTSTAATYAVLAVAGVSALAWPIIAVKLIGALITRLLHKV